MQWGHIKTLFILSFLLLNIYLVSAFIDRQQEIGYLDSQELPIEDQLASEEITYEDVSSIDEMQMAYISVIQRDLTVEDMEELADLEEQTTEVFQDNIIISELEESIPLSKEMTAEELESNVLPKVLYGEEYTYWNWDEEVNVVVFFQEKEDSTIYFNENGLLIGFLNEDGELTHYAQTILGESEVQGELVQLNQPVQVIGQLYNANYLNRGDEITDMKIGYYSRITAEGIQVFAPTWNVEINEEENQFVNAAEGVIYESNPQEFLLDIIGEHAVRMNSLSESNELRDSTLPLLEERLEIDNRSETE